MDFNVNMSLLSTEENVFVLLASQIKIIIVRTLSSVVLPLSLHVFCPNQKPTDVK